MRATFIDNSSKQDVHLAASWLRTPCETRNSERIHENVYRRFRGLIVSGALAQGARIPSSRKLASDLGISRNSVLTALDRLIADGWLETRERSGVYVSYDGPAVTAALMPFHARDEDGGKTPFALGWASDIFPVVIWKRLQSQRWRRMPQTMLEQADRKGLPALRAAIAAHVTLRRGLQCSPAQVFVTTCIPAAIDLAIAALNLAGSVFWAENPCCPVTHRSLVRSGIRVVPIPVDGDGADIECGTTRAPKAAGALVSPACQLPTGVALAGSRRRQLAEWADRNGAWIFEDDYNWNGDGHLGPPPYAATDPRRTIYFNSFNSVLFPGLRVAYLVAPPETVDRFAAVRGSEGDVNAANQIILTDFLEGGYLDAHLRRLDDCNRERRAALADSIDRELPDYLEASRTPGGFYICRLNGLSEREALNVCKRANIVVCGMSEFFLTPTTQNEIVLGFSRHRPKAISRGAVALRATLKAGFPELRNRERQTIRAY